MRLTEIAAWDRGFSTCRGTWIDNIYCMTHTVGSSRVLLKVDPLLHLHEIRARPPGMLQGNVKEICVKEKHQICLFCCYEIILLVTSPTTAHFLSFNPASWTRLLTSTLKEFDLDSLIRLQRSAVKVRVTSRFRTQKWFETAPVGGGVQPQGSKSSFSSTAGHLFLHYSFVFYILPLPRHCVLMH